MVKLTTKYLLKKNKYNKYFLIRKKNDTDKQFLNRITHLPLQSQFIEQILKVNDCENVKFLYLQNNLLKSIENLDNFPNLTHLYLQRNFLVKIENLNCLVYLKKIYLGHNEIQVLEGFENLKKVREIHLESQNLSAGEAFYFEPLSIKNLRETLLVLNLSDNNLFSLSGLKGLLSLRVFIANYNCLRDIDDVTGTISAWSFLTELSLIGNDVTRIKWYRDFIIYASKSLEVLDNEPIHFNTREFIEKLIEQKKLFYKKHVIKTEKLAKKEKRKTHKTEDDFESKQNCFDFTNSISTTGPVYLYPAWKLRTHINSVNSETLLPRPFWKKRSTQKK